MATCAPFILPANFLPSVLKFGLIFLTTKPSVSVINSSDLTLVSAKIKSCMARISLSNFGFKMGSNARTKG